MAAAGPRGGGSAPRLRNGLRRGAVAGALGSIVVALAQGAADLILGQSLLHTPEVLGRGLGGLPPGGGSLLPVLLFTLFHVAVFVTIGIALGAAAAGTGRRFHTISIALFIIVFFGSATMAAALDPLREALPSWSIVVANVAALGLMGWVLAPRTARGT